MIVLSHKEIEKVKNSILSISLFKDFITKNNGFLTSPEGKTPSEVRNNMALEVVELLRKSVLNNLASERPHLEKIDSFLDRIEFECLELFKKDYLEGNGDINEILKYTFRQFSIKYRIILVSILMSHSKINEDAMAFAKENASRHFVSGLRNITQPIQPEPTMKIYTVDFIGKYPVPHGLVINATSLEEASKIASETIKHTDKFTVSECNTSKSGVIFYESGEY